MAKPFAWTTGSRAEGFRRYRHHPYPTTPALEGLLGEAVLSLANWPD